MSLDLSLVTEIILEASVWSAIIRVYGVVSALGYSGSIKKKRQHYLIISVDVCLTGRS